MCDICDFNCSKKSSYDRHLLTRKHKKNTLLTDFEQDLTKKEPNLDFRCVKCDKKYKSRVGLWYHFKKCNNTIKKCNNIINKDINNKDELIELLLQENSDFKNIILEVVKSNNNLQQQVIDMCKSTNSNNIINSNNKTFNLQFFLNEQCKDAMNISDFVNSVSLSIDDLEKIGNLGYVNGISSIIIKELKCLDITKRPVHCSDAKRETLYIKDKDKWEKECSENKKIKNIIKNVETKNIKLINEWTDKHPNFINSTSIENDKYLKIIKESMGGKGNYEENKNKIIKKIVKEIIINK